MKRFFSRGWSSGSRRDLSGEIDAGGKKCIVDEEQILGEMAKGKGKIPDRRRSVRLVKTRRVLRESSKVGEQGLGKRTVVGN